MTHQFYKIKDAMEEAYRSLEFAETCSSFAMELEKENQCRIFEELGAEILSIHEYIADHASYLASNDPRKMFVALFNECASSGRQRKWGGY